MSHVEDLKVRGVVKDGSVVLDERLALPEGTQVLVTITHSQVGSPRAVLSAMTAAPQLGDDDVAALLHELDRGKRPVRFGSPLERD